MSMWTAERNNARTLSDRIETLLSKMSLEDKIGQMSQIDFSILLMDDLKTGRKVVNQSRLEYYFGELGVGSLLNNVAGERWNATEYRQVVLQIAQVSKKHDRPPVVWGLDSVHGANYVHGAIVAPQPLSMAATFNTTVAEWAGHLASRDTRAAGITWLFSPLLGIALEPLWSRVYETFGEDPVLVGDMGLALIRGIQEPDSKNGAPSKAAACAKHFVGYSMPHNGHDRAPSWIPTRHLYQYFVPPWRKGLKEVATVMEDYTDYDGVPNVGNSKSLNLLLRQQLGFDGALVTDYEEIRNLALWHHTAASTEDAILRAIEHGSVDMSMIPFDAEGFRDGVKKGIEDNMFTMERIDRSARRVLQLKEDLGMMDEELTMDDPKIALVGSDHDHEEAMHAVRQSIILAENKDSVLPIATDTPKKVHVTGPTSDALRYQSGGWTWQWQGTTTDEKWFSYGTTVLSAAKGVYNFDVTASCGVAVTGDDCIDDFAEPTGVVNKLEKFVGIGGNADSQSIDRAVAKANGSDYVIVCIGEENYAEKPGDIQSLALPLGHMALVQALASTKAKVILVYFGGRPRLLDQMVEHVDAVLLGFLPGPDAGLALMEIITGEVNPSAKLPITYPKFEDRSGVPYFHAVSDQCTTGDGLLPHYQYAPCAVQWPFGHGLSYTSFEYSNLRLSSTELAYHAEGQPREHLLRSKGDEKIKVSVDVKNAGDIDGVETVLLYTFDESRWVTPEYKRMRGYEKLFLKAGETQTVDMLLDRETVQFIGPDDDSHLVVQDGMKFFVGIGAHVDCRTNPDSDMCSDAITVVAGESYIGQCEAACDLWTASGCSDSLHLTASQCWTSCASANDKNGWGWSYVSCIEASMSTGGADQCALIDSNCRVVFGPGVSAPVTFDPAATVASLFIGLVASLIIGLGIRGDLFRWWDKWFPQEPEVEFIPIETEIE